MRAIVFMWLTMDAPTALPSMLRHRVTASLPSAPVSSGGDGAKSEPIEVKGEGCEIRVTAGAPLLISPPLRGGEWLAANGPGNSSGHRRALLPVEGAAHIAQRFAIDWVQLREDGRTFTGDKLKNENYRCYGAEALAVADGAVVAVKDGIPENIPGANSRAVPITLETVGGNHVILDIGQGRYAFYAHLQPGSLKVKAGDRVRRGQVLGLVGNSGNSTEPHLHFHISNANSPLASEGLPYVFESFEQQGQGFGWKASATDPPAQKRSMEIPVQNAVVRFPAAR
jgi:murein DD-endopeptidase MepM/ murein hydrolase activator NlpD